jgi:hypothetical protein
MSSSNSKVLCDPGPLGDFIDKQAPKHFVGEAST